MNNEDIVKFAKEIILENPGSKMDAIKVVREKYSLGLKEAKEFVDDAYRELSKTNPELLEMSKSKGCLTLIAVGMGLSFLTYHLM